MTAPSHGRSALVLPLAAAAAALVGCSGAEVKRGPDRPSSIVDEKSSTVTMDAASDHDPLDVRRAIAHALTTILDDGRQPPVQHARFQANVTLRSHITRTMVVPNAQTMPYPGAGSIPTPALQTYAAIDLVLHAGGEPREAKGSATEICPASERVECEQRALVSVLTSTLQQASGFSRVLDQ